MPSPQAQGTLQTAGDTLTVPLGNSGAGMAGDVSAVLSLTGTYTGATVAVEAVPLGQPLTQGLTNVTPPSPTSASEWVPIQEVGIVDGIPVSSPVGPLTSAGGAGSGYAFTLNCSVFSQIRLRLVSIGAGAIQGGIATVPFPIPGLTSAQSPPALLLEMQRIRIGIGMLVDTDLRDALPALTSSS